MNVFYYDKTFDGLLSAVFDAYTLKAFPGALLGPEDATPLMAEREIRVNSTPEKQSRVYAALKERLSEEGLHQLFLAWLAEEAGGDCMLFNYIRLILDTKRRAETDLSHPVVLDVHMLARKVDRERHRLLGFARFQKTAEDIYCALIAPRHNVLPLMLHHFADRYADQRWILYDRKRDYGFMFDAGDFREVNLDEGSVENGGLAPHLLAKNEEFLQGLWKGYFSAASIKERTCARRQRGFLPKRFWEHLTEMR